MQEPAQYIKGDYATYADSVLISVYRASIRSLESLEKTNRNGGATYQLKRAHRSECLSRTRKQLELITIELKKRNLLRNEWGFVR